MSSVQRRGVANVLLFCPELRGDESNARNIRQVHHEIYSLITSLGR